MLKKGPSCRRQPTIINPNKTKGWSLPALKNKTKFFSSTAFNCFHWSMIYENIKEDFKLNQISF